jgi:hypothetical protein
LLLGLVLPLSSSVTDIIEINRTKENERKRVTRRREKNRNDRKDRKNRNKENDRTQRGGRTKKEQKEEDTPLYIRSDSAIFSRVTCWPAGSLLFMGTWKFSSLNNFFSIFLISFFLSIAAVSIFCIKN